MVESERVNCLAVDGSDSSKNAFDWYIKNYHSKDDTLVIIHAHQVPQMPAMGVMAGYAPLEAFQMTVESSIRSVNKMLNYYTKICDEKNIKYRTVIEDDYHGTGYKICESVKKNLGTIVILGQRGLGTVSRFLLGSTSDYVLHHCNVPVVVVPVVAKPAEN